MVQQYTETGQQGVVFHDRKGEGNSIQQYAEFRRRLLLGMLLVIVLGTFWHSVYDLSGQNRFFGLFFPANESVWEHLKMVFWPMALLNLYFSMKYRDMEYPVQPSVLFGTAAGMLGVTTFFYTYRGILGYGIAWMDMAAFYIGLFFALFVILHWVKHMFWKSGKFAEILLWAVHLVLAVLFIWFTYHPPGLGIFQNH